MEHDAVRFEDVWRSYGSMAVLRGLDLRVPRGSITALLGRNGTGKTTALKCLLGLLRLQQGRIFVLGRDAMRLDVGIRERVGYLSERPMLDERLTVGQTLEFARALTPRWDAALEADLLERLDLWRKAPLTALSLGQTRKVGLVVALAARPDVLVLDEPAASLDVVVRREFLEAVLELFRTEGMSVLFSTHMLSDVERVADRVVLLEEGQTRLESELDDLKDRVKAIRLAPRNGRPLPELSVPGLLRERHQGREMLLTVEQFHPELVHRLEQETGALVEVRDLSLEDIFLAYAAAGAELR